MAAFLYRGFLAPNQRTLAELQRRKQAIVGETEDIAAGHVRLMDATRVRERFLQVSDTACAHRAPSR